MHDLIFAVAFVAMVTTPAMVAAIGGRKEYNPGALGSLDALCPPGAFHGCAPRDARHERAADADQRACCDDDSSLFRHDSENRGAQRPTGSGGWADAADA